MSAGTILLVEDNPITRKMLRVVLEIEGYDVVDAPDGKTALELTSNRRPDLVIFDYVLPDTDGLQLLAEVRRRAGMPEVPAILITGMVSRLEELRALGGGATHVLAKPIEPSQLREVVRAQLTPETGRAHGQRILVVDDEPLNLKLAAVRLRRAGYEVEAARGGREALGMARHRRPDAILSDVMMPSMDGFTFCRETRRDPSLGSVPIVLVSSAYVDEADRELARQMGAQALVVRTPDMSDALTAIEAALRGSAETAPPTAADDVSALHQERLQVQLERQNARNEALLRQLGEALGELVLASDSHDLSEESWIGFAHSLALQFGQTVALGQSLKRLAASESRYRALMEHANDAIYVLDPQGTILEANERSDTLLGLPRDRVIGAHISDFAAVAPGETPEYLARVQQVLAAGGGHVDNVALRRGDGSLVEVDFSMSLKTIDGKATVLSIGRDVTERNRAATALREAQERLHHVVSHSPAVLYSLRPEGDRFVATWISENVERLLGYTAEDVLPADWWPSHLHPEDRDRALAQMAGLLTSGYVEHEYRFRRKDGEYRWLRAEVRLLRDGSGHPVEAVGSWSDVSARKDAERKLQQSEEQYRLLFDSNPFPMAVVDRQSLAFLAVNDASVRSYGYSRDEFLTMTLRDIRVPEEIASLPDEYGSTGAESSRAGRRAATMRRHRKKDGTVIEVEIERSAILFRARPAWLLLAADVTDKKSLEAQLVKAQKMEAVGQLAGGIAHDFNNLLGVITGYSELLIRELPPDSRERKRGEGIKRAADRAAALTRQLLAFSRRQVLQPKVLDLNDIVAEVEKMMTRLIAENIQIVTTAAPKLGKVRADAGQVEQVLMNLAINARDAMSSGGRLLIETDNVELDETYVRRNPEARAGSYVMLAVSDTGHGMDANTMSRIFEPFFTTKEDGKGTGLGLATVYGIVRQSGGTVNVYSEPGRGTIFRVYLPRVDAAAEPEARIEPAAPSGGTETILLVEDSDSLRPLVRELLENAGYTVLEAETPDKALSLAQSTTGPIHLVLTDMVMPRMSGQELARALLTRKPEARVVFMSGYSDQAFGDQGTSEPGTHFLQKPFTMDALLRTMRRALDAGRAANDRDGS